MITSISSVSPAVVPVVSAPAVAAAAQGVSQDALERTNSKTKSASAARPATRNRAPNAPRRGWRTFGLAAGACMSTLVGTACAMPTTSLQTPLTMNIPMSDSAGNWHCNTTQGVKNLQLGNFSVQPDGKAWRVSQHEMQRDGSYEWSATVYASGIAWQGEGTFVMNTSDAGEERGNLSLKANPLFTGWEWVLDVDLPATWLGLRLRDDIRPGHLKRDTHVLTETGGPWNIFSHSTCALD